MMKRIAVSANYEAIKHGVAVKGRVDFIARVADHSRGCGLTLRAQRAVVRRLRVRLADVKITGVMST